MRKFTNKSNRERNDSFSKPAFKYIRQLITFSKKGNDKSK